MRPPQVITGPTCKRMMIRRNFAVFVMHEYQKKHNVKDCSMTNCQLIFDLFKLKVRPCFVSLHDEQVCGPHLVNMLDDKTFIDATYQFSHRKDVEYFFDPILTRDDAKAELTKMQVRSLLLRNKRAVAKSSLTAGLRGHDQQWTLSHQRRKGVRRPMGHHGTVHGLHGEQV